MAVKLDLKKAYDGFSWNFIMDTLRDISIPDLLVSSVMKCITTSSIRVLWNGEATEKFHLSRDICQ